MRLSSGPARAGADTVTREAQLLVGSLDKSQKARLTTMLVDHHHRSGQVADSNAGLDQGS